MSALASRADVSLGARYREEVEALVERGLIDESLKRLQDCVRDLSPGLKRDTLMLCSRYNEFKSARRRGIVSGHGTDPAIVDAILQLICDATEGGSIQPHLQIVPLEGPPATRGPIVHGRETAALAAAAPLPDVATKVPGAAAAIVPAAQLNIVPPHLPNERPETGSATVYPFPRAETAPASDEPETLNEFRKTYWRRFGDQSPPERSIACLAENIARGYRGTPFKLEPLSFKLRAGEITGVVGRNAAGKTTLLRMVLGELAPHEGRLSYPMLTTEGNSWAHIKSQIGYVPQLPARWPGRLRENLNFAASIAGTKGRANRELVEWNMQRYGLTGYADYRWEELSGGYKVRFELAKTLVSRPRLLVLDEPLAHLDVIGRQEFLANLAAIASSFEQPVPIIITSQHLYEIEAIADQMIILDGGQCIYAGRLDGLPDVVPHRKLELTIRIAAKSIEAALKPHGATAIEPTMDGYIVSFPKNQGAGDLFAVVSRAFGDKLTAVRDITGSARSLFKEELDHLPPMDGAN